MVGIEQHHGRTEHHLAPALSVADADHLGVRQACLDILDPPLNEALLLACRMVFRVLL